MSEAAETDTAEPRASELRTEPARPLTYRGRVFKALTLTPQTPLSGWLAGLDATLSRSPTLLLGRGVILNVTAFASEPAALRAALDELRGRNIRVLGLEGPLDPEVSRDCTLPPHLLGGRPAPDLDLPVEPQPAPLSSVTIEGTVRSGQTVVNLTGDVTVTGSVSSGAEILAGGNIHVYGALRGRAIAGAARNPRARIYCRRFEPELLGIDRLVRSADEVGATLRGKPAQVWLDAGAMHTALLD